MSLKLRSEICHHAFLIKSDVFAVKKFDKVKFLKLNSTVPAG